MVGLAAVGLVLARFQNNSRADGQIDPVGRLVLAITTPISAPMGNALDNNSRFWSAVFQSESLRRENSRLKSQEQSWRQYREIVSSLETQLDQLRKTVALDPIKTRAKVAADIITFDPVTSRITLDIGTNQGIKPGQAVVTGTGIVGQIQTVDATRSQALLISSPVLRLGAMINGDPPIAGLIRGQGPRRLVFEIVESSRVFKQGELVVTSVHSERTPANIPIGIVLAQEPAQEYGITRIIVVPTVDVAKVREVFVLK